MSDLNLKDIVMLVGVLPVIADKIEDLNSSVFSKALKNKANMLIEEIRKADSKVLAGGDIRIFEEQHNIGLSFRAWCEEHFKNVE